MSGPSSGRARVDVFERGGPVPPDPDGTLLVLLHGRGADERDLQGLRPLLPDAWTVVTPRAVHPGAPWGYGPGWAWYRYIADDRVEPESLARSTGALDDFLSELPERIGGASASVVLGGFSQGGTLSLAYALSRPERVRAVLNFSGFLAASVRPTPPPSGHAPLPPVFWGHGLHDPAIPHSLAVRGRARLRAAGVEVTASDYPIGHGIAPEEIEEAVRWYNGLSLA